MAETKVEPREGQKWTHRSYGGTYEVEPVGTASVVIRSADGRQTARMLKEQLWEHYDCVSE